MKYLLKNWKNRMVAYREEADETEIPNVRIKSMAKFMTLRDCIRELEQLESTRVGNSLVADIRNKLTPPNNLCAMLKNRDVEPFIGDDPRNKMIDKEIDQTLKSIKYLSNL